MAQQAGFSESPEFVGPSRRDFLKFAALLAGSVGLQSLPGFRHASSAAVDPRAYASSQFALELDGVLLNFVKSVEGGFARADVVTEKLSASLVSKKHLANLKYTDIAMQCDPSMTTPLLNWIATMGVSHPRKNGAIITADLDMKERSRLEFFNAFVTEVTIPPCDASARDAGLLTIKLTPEYTRPMPGRSTTLPGIFGTAKQQKLWMPANFRLQIQGLEEACARINKIEALTIKQNVVENAVGQMRDYQREPGALEFSNLTITLPESFAGPFYQWFDDFVIKGNAGDDRERPGFLELLSPDRQTVLLRINFSNLGIISFSPEKQTSGMDTIARVRVEMYCEQITITDPMMAAAQSAPPPAPAPRPNAPPPASLETSPSVQQKPPLLREQIQPGMMQRPLMKP